MTEPTETTSITIEMDRPTQLFYKGCGAASKVSEKFADFPRPVTTEHVNAWWFYVGIVAGLEHGISEEEDVVNFLRGATLNSPRVPTQEELEEQLENAAIDALIAEITEAFPEAVAALFTVSEYENGWFYTERPRVQLADGTTVEWEDSETELDGGHTATLSRLYEPGQYDSMILKLDDYETVQDAREWPVKSLLPASS